MAFIKRLCIIFGGVSSEHEVSLMSAASVISNIDRTLFEVVMLGITKDGRWLLYEGAVEDIKSGKWQSSPNLKPAVISPDRGHGGIILPGENRTIPVDVVFGVLHGLGGEDGTLQGLLELAGIPYVGCGVLSSALCMDKGFAHIVLTAAGIPKVKLHTIYAGEERDLALLERQLAQSLGYPMFVKPANSGSSVGVSKVSAPNDLEAALSLAFIHDRKVIVEEAVLGQEVECSVIGSDRPVASEVLGEIVPADFYDYQSKYQDDSAQLIVPAKVDEKTAAKIRELALKAYKAMECKGFARIDFFVRKDGQVILNEINTIPGFTQISMFPRMFIESGMSYKEIVTRLVNLALDKEE